MADAATHPSYASVNGLEMYYEVHGSGQPLVLLHGAFGATSTFAQLLPALTATRKIIALDLQGHGRTVDIDRPFSYERMADDTAAFMRELGIESADILGYSMGGGVALQLAIRHPTLVRKLVVASATYNSGGMYPEVLESIATITPEAFAGSSMEAEYLKLAPKPDAWPTLINKIKQLDATVQDWPAQDIQALRAPTLLIIGDSDVVRPEHAVELFRLLGGGVAGDLSGLPDAQLAVLPGTTHITVMDKTDLLLAVILPFLDAPMRDAA